LGAGHIDVTQAETWRTGGSGAKPASRLGACRETWRVRRADSAFPAMGRTASWSGYTTKIGYIVGFETTGLHTRKEAMQRATGAVARMRRKGAASPIRCVEVRQWGDWDRDKLTYRCPPLFQASYYDPEQGLTDTEVYAARVHDWHALKDRMDGNLAANKLALANGVQRLVGRLWTRAGLMSRLRTGSVVPRTLKPVHDRAPALPSGQEAGGRGNPPGVRTRGVRLGSRAPSN
jgi:hypothetical protein